MESHHDGGAYETPQVLNLPAIWKMVDRRGFAPRSPACGAGDLLNDRAAQEKKNGSGGGNRTHLLAAYEAGAFPLGYSAVC